MARASDTTGVILAGGKSRRMGRDKALLELGGKTLIDRVLERFVPLFPELIVVTNDIPRLAPPGATVVSDLLPGAGALGGLYTGLVYASFPRIFICACDMPFVSPAAIEYLLHQADRYDVVLPVFPDGPHPLHAVYGKRCKRPIATRLAAGSLRIIDFFPEVRVLEVTRDSLEGVDPELRSVWNLNTPEDLREAEAIIRKGA